MSGNVVCQCCGDTFFRQKYASVARYCPVCKENIERWHKKAYKDKQRALKKAGKQTKIHEYTCRTCGKHFTSEKINLHYCSDECRTIARDKASKATKERQKAAKQRAKEEKARKAETIEQMLKRSRHQHNYAEEQVKETCAMIGSIDHNYQIWKEQQNDRKSIEG